MQSPLRTLGSAMLVAATLVGCATPPIRDTARVVALRPLDVQQQPARDDGAEVLWGGRIVAFDHRSGHAEIEVVSYPLARDQSPLTEAPSEGRFMLQLSGFVEPLDYAVGRHLTVRGILAGTHAGMVQEQPYLYPVVRGREVHVWPWGFMLDRRPRVHVGVGVRVR
ncbi:MAG TPA: Slp family lipoprotein [Dokdonella sp.]|uniref:Slp family lipoprotein n=1 Tax=Dokdonella sp. TaxID=2291710 RepID=UPI0025BB11DF|nr:Slp family lipoprotein [Dokdonella sp.]MBX3692699.1 Slp family lipoprotein [Dokdonella sp.]MCW5568063.1 Slp family lipoprotein [Dokdonella sp.]HNR91352.1 Slp family lipoprotein [Dokdonella sp.]